MKEKKTKFVFNNENLLKAKDIIAKYPANRQKSASLPLLDLAQRQNDNWLSIDVIEYVADMLGEPYMRLYEVASFYTMFNLKPLGKYHIQVCGTTPCWLNGAAEILSECEKLTKTQLGDTSKDRKFTISEVECLGACRNAPVVQINDDFYEDLTKESLKEVINKLK